MDSRPDDLLFLPLLPGPLGTEIPIALPVLYGLCAVLFAVAVPLGAVGLVEMCVTPKPRLAWLFFCVLGFALSAIAIGHSAVLFPSAMRALFVVYTVFMYGTMIQIWYLALSFCLSAMMLPNMQHLFGVRGAPTIVASMFGSIAIALVAQITMAATWDQPDQTTAIVAWRVMSVAIVVFLFVLFGSLSMLTKRFSREIKKLQRERTFSVQAQLRRNRRVQVFNQNLHLGFTATLWLLHSSILPGYWFLIFAHFITITFGTAMSVSLFIPSVRLSYYQNLFCCGPRRNGPSSPSVASARRSTLGFARKQPDTPTRLEAMLAKVAGEIQMAAYMQDSPTTAPFT